MTQAVGASGYYSYVNESSYGVTPGSPAMKKLGAALFGGSLGGKIEELVSNAITGSRARATVRGGNIDAGGSLPFELPLLGFGGMLKNALGTSTSGRNVTLGSGITGVTLRYADSTCPTGAGTLTKSGSNLTWQANGDGTAGAAVDVSAGGDFTLQSGTANHALYVTVTTAGGTTATATVSSTQYKHIIKRGVLGSFTVEAGFADITKYLVYTGCKVDKMSLTVGTSGLVTGNFDLIAQGVAANSAALGTPSSVVHTPFVQHEAVILEGGSALNTIGFKMDLANALDGNVRAVGNRSRLSLPEGMGDLSGEITCMFEDLTYVSKWLNETQTSLKATFSNASGSVEFLVPAVKYFGDAAPKLSSAQGIVVPLSWRGMYDAATGTDLQISIINTEATL